MEAFFKFVVLLILVFAVAGIKTDKKKVHEKRGIADLAFSRSSFQGGRQFEVNKGHNIDFFDLRDAIGDSVEKEVSLAGAAPAGQARVTTNLAGERGFLLDSDEISRLFSFDRATGGSGLRDILGKVKTAAQAQVKSAAPAATSAPVAPVTAAPVAVVSKAAPAAVEPPVAPVSQPARGVLLDSGEIVGFLGSLGGLGQVRTGSATPVSTGSKTQVKTAVVVAPASVESVEVDSALATGRAAEAAQPFSQGLIIDSGEILRFLNSALRFNQPATSSGGPAPKPPVAEANAAVEVPPTPAAPTAVPDNAVSESESHVSYSGEGDVSYEEILALTTKSLGDEKVDTEATVDVVTADGGDSVDTEGDGEIVSTRITGIGAAVQGSGRVISHVLKSPVYGKGVVGHQNVTKVSHHTRHLVHTVTRPVYGVRTRKVVEYVPQQIVRTVYKPVVKYVKEPFVRHIQRPVVQRVVRPRINYVQSPIVGTVKVGYNTQHFTQKDAAEISAAPAVSHGVHTNTIAAGHNVHAPRSTSY